MMNRWLAAELIVFMLGAALILGIVITWGIVIARFMETW